LDMGALKEKSFTRVGDGGLAIAAGDPDVSAVLVVITTGPMLGDFTRAMAGSIKATGKPALFVVIQGQADDGAREILKQNGMPVFETLDEAFRVLGCWMRGQMFAVSSEPLNRPAGVPEQPAGYDLPPSPTEHEVKTLAAHYGIATVLEETAETPDAAVAAARRIGYPVVLKASGRNLVHKSEAGGVVLNLKDELALREAWEQIMNRLGTDFESCLVCRMESADAEMILGINHDPEFGPMVLFGLGGLVAEIVDDVILTSTPVTPQRAMALLQTLKLWPLLDGARGRPQLDADAVCDMISRLSWLAHDLRDSLLELDLNPVMVKRRGEGAVAVDARASLRLNH
ncbi:MAG TPA: acetate--CoA ligase family protein, partial [Arenicellales bacterium]|nr:acetate--CoA ligase family protein [Arenicellales bacterium]